GGGAEMQLLGDRNEVAQQPEVHPAEAGEVEVVAGAREIGRGRRARRLACGGGMPSCKQIRHLRRPPGERGRQPTESTRETADWGSVTSKKLSRTEAVSRRPSARRTWTVAPPSGTSPNTCL